MLLPRSLSIEVAMSLLRLRPAVLALAVALCLAPAMPARACSEGLFNSGKGLAFQGYLAPRPAVVLLYSTAPEDQRVALRAGLQRAGHRVTEVGDASALAAALAANHYDVVITGLDAASAVPASATDDAPRVLPVVARAQRSSPQVRDRYPVVVVDGASLGQYLRGINRLLSRDSR
jgi:hypothetical protein